MARSATPLCPSRRTPAFAGVACAKKHLAITFRPSLGSRVQTSFGPEGNPAPSARLKRWPAITAVSAAPRSHIGAVQSIASPSPSAVSTSPTIFHRRCSTASKIDHPLPTGLRKVRASRALNQHRGRPGITPQDNIQITTLRSGQPATANREVVMTQLRPTCHLITNLARGEASWAAPEDTGMNGWLC